MSGKSSPEGGGVEEEQPCRCVHRAILGCLMPEAIDTLASFEHLRRQLKKTRQRLQQQQQKVSSP